MNQTDSSAGDQELTFVGHLIELRQRLLKACVAVIIVLVALMPFSRKLYALIAQPLLDRLPDATSMIAIDVASPFLAPFKLTLVLSLLIAMPVVIYQLWAFVAPGLYRNEQKLAKPLLVSATLLFYLGCSFAYFVVFPVVFLFFSQFAPEGVTYTPDISSYLHFVFVLFLAFGIAFEVPIATIILVASGITTTKQLAAKRAYVIVGAFAVGMLLTPPDVISQTLLALPMWVLYEAGIIMSKILLRPKSKPQAEESTG